MVERVGRCVDDPELSSNDLRADAGINRLRGDSFWTAVAKLSGDTAFPGRPPLQAAAKAAWRFASRRSPNRSQSRWLVASCTLHADAGMHRLRGVLRFPPYSNSQRQGRRSCQ